WIVEGCSHAGSNLKICRPSDRTARRARTDDGAALENFSRSILRGQYKDCLGLTPGRPRRLAAAVQESMGLPLRLRVRGGVATATLGHELVELGLVLGATQAI